MRNLIIKKHIEKGHYQCLFYNSVSSMQLTNTFLRLLMVGFEHRCQNRVPRTLLGSINFEVAALVPEMTSWILI